MAGEPQYQVRVRDMRFYSVKLCAQILKLHPGTVYRAVARGKTETLGLGRGYKVKHGGGRAPKPVKFGTLTFPSIADAERELGYARGSLNNILRNGKRRSRENLAKRLMIYADRNKKERQDEDM